MEPAIAYRYRRAYEEERQQRAREQVQEGARRDALAKQAAAEKGALTTLEKSIRERLALAQAVDKRIRLERKAAKGASPRQHVVRAGTDTALAFAFEAPRGGPVRVTAAIKTKGAAAPEVEFQAAPSEISEGRIDDVIEGWLRRVARL